MKICSKCEVEKPLSQFHKLAKSKDGHRPDCKKCAMKIKYKDKGTLDYTIKQMVQNIRNRLRSTHKSKNKCYEGIECKLGNNPFETIKINFGQEIQRLIENGEKPSVDRINSNGHYEVCNIQIIKLEENVKRGLENACKVCSKPIRAIHDDKEVIYKSISEASRDIGIKRDTIYAHLDKGTKAKKGMRFESYGHNQTIQR